MKPKTTVAWVLAAIGCVYACLYLQQGIYYFEDRMSIPRALRADVPEGAYDTRHLDPLKKAIEQLASNCSKDYAAARAANPGSYSTNLDLARKYLPLESSLIGPSTPPEDLAMLAMWAYRKDPSSADPHNRVYHEVFFCNIGRLGEMNKDKRAALALWKVKDALTKDGRFSGRTADTVSEAIERQTTGGHWLIDRPDWRQKNIAN